jgi:hypothetical protein
LGSWTAAAAAAGVFTSAEAAAEADIVGRDLVLAGMEVSIFTFIPELLLAIYLDRRAECQKSGMYK